MAKVEIISGINSDRINWCCAQIKMDLSDFADAIGIAHEKLTSGSLTFRQLQKMADYFGYGVLFFLEDGVPRNEKVHSPAYRTLANQEIPLDGKMSKLIRNLEKHRDFFVGLLEEEGNDISFFEKPQFTGETLEEKALEVRRWLQIDGVNTKKDFKIYRKLFERKNIFVILSAGYRGAWRVEAGELEGFSIRHEKIPIIFSKKTNDKRQVFTIFHELGHLLLHDDEACIDVSRNFSSKGHTRKENEANSFAGYCLLPENLLRNVYENIPQKADDYDEAFEAFSRNLGISVEVILVRLLNERKISRENYNTYKKIKSEVSQSTVSQSVPISRRRYAEPARIFGHRYVNTVLSALGEDRITLNKASDYLDKIKIKNFKDMRSYALRS